MSESDNNQNLAKNDQLTNEEIDFKYRSVERYRLTYDKVFLTRINNFITYFNNFYPYRAVNQYIQANYMTLTSIFGDKKINEDRTFLAQASIHNFDSYKI